jgi:hypothetical protein
MAKKKIYIAGPITGMEEQARENFTHAAIQLGLDGHEVVNPFDLDHNHDKEWKSYMKVCIKALVECNAIYFLKNWKQSRGAALEYTIAYQMDLNILFEKQ